MTSALPTSPNATYFPEISLAKEFVQAEDKFLKKITKIFFCIILSPIALFLDISHNVRGFFKSKSINSKTDDKSFIEKTKYIWANHKKTLAFGFITIGALIGLRSLYYSIKPLVHLNERYINCQNKALHQINHLKDSLDSNELSRKNKLRRLSLFDHKNREKINDISHKVSDTLQSEINIATPAANKALFQCKTNYNASFVKIKKHNNVLAMLFKFFKYDID